MPQIFPSIFNASTGNSSNTVNISVIGMNGSGKSGRHLLVLVNVFCIAFVVKYLTKRFITEYAPYLISTGKKSRIFALKMISKLYLRQASQGLDSKAIKEAELHRKFLNTPHKNVIRWHESFHTPLYFCNLFDFSGVSLFDLIESLPSGKIREEKHIYKIARDVLRGLLYVHSKGIVHRDLKSENILISFNQVAKIADFGVSREIPPGDGLMNTFVGSLPYLAPEVILSAKPEIKDYLRVSKKTDGYTKDVDFWSFGILLCEMATGEYPFEKHLSSRYSENEEQLNRAVLREICSPRKTPIPDSIRIKFPSLFLVICLLLKKNIHERLADRDIMQHLFFMQYKNKKIGKLPLKIKRPDLKELSRPDELFENFQCIRCEYREQAEGIFVPTYQPIENAVCANCSLQHINT
ncbi:hypothetical protein Ciccas_010210 [Cichlidogyrus casuarinus]|uniref:Protein kinase domain-containing protein n=1 Tax=Cichlidogyrus casuarinus TaxID=1844966 RepID=A0ABD2PWD6_9PLAT